MKLYATVTSERASKGQGGNEYLDIAITVSSKHVHAGRITVQEKYNEKDSYIVHWIPEGGHSTSDGVVLCEILPEFIEYKTKGEKQKGEAVCEYHGVRNCSRCYPHLQ